MLEQNATVAPSTTNVILETPLPVSPAVAVNVMLALGPTFPEGLLTSDTAGGELSDVNVFERTVDLPPEISPIKQ